MNHQLLHPTIPVANEHLTVADVGTGTGYAQDPGVQHLAHGLMLSVQDLATRPGSPAPANGPLRRPGHQPGPNPSQGAAPCERQLPQLRCLRRTSPGSRRKVRCGPCAPPHLGGQGRRPDSGSSQSSQDAQCVSSPCPWGHALHMNGRERHTTLATDLHMCS